MLIRLENLQKTYFTGEVETPVLHDIDLCIDKGEFVSIMGPSGSGKSTLLHIIGLLDDPTGGEYLLYDKHIGKYTKKQLAGIRNENMGFVFQSFNLLKRTSVYDNVKLPLMYSHIKETEWKTRIDTAIESVGLAHRAHHHPNSLSGGERQRVAIARALVTGPDIIFADEPTGNLDSKTGKMIMDILYDLNTKGGHTVILITHEHDTARYAQRIVQLLDGVVKKDTKVTKRNTSNSKLSK
ncbi:ABC transporter ATP-binding protein [Candidatus Nomurabacteria bacterium]|nr:ABC transporter ATP-binding protein [Candidatus Nomurabacteria bacterium]